MTRGRNAVSVHHCARRRVGIVADYNRVRKYASQMNSGKTRTATTHSNRCVTATVWIQLIIFPRLANVPAWWTATSWRVRVTPDRRQKLNPRRTSARPTIFTLDPSAITMGCRERLLGIKTREVSGLDLSPSLFIYYLFLQSSLVFFFRPLPPSSSTPPCFLLFFLTLYLRVCPLHNLLVIMTPGDSGVSFALFFPPTLPIFSRTY